MSGFFKAGESYEFAHGSDTAEILFCETDESDAQLQLNATRNGDEVNFLKMKKSSCPSLIMKLIY